MSFLASIPSPSNGTIDLGPLTIHMYGLTLLAAIGICIWITGTRFVNRGGDWDLIFRCAVWGVGAGIVGARLYHLATSWNEVPDQWWGAVRDLERRPRSLGRDRRGMSRRRLHRQAGRRRRVAARRLPRTRPARRPGGRADRQLVEPGALREADRSARGGSRSTRSTGRSRRSTRRPTTPRSSTSSSGTSSRRPCSST